MTRDIALERNLKHRSLTKERKERRENGGDSSVRVYRKQKGRQSMMSTWDDESF